MRPFHNWEIRRWTLEPKGIIKHAEKINLKGGGRCAAGCLSRGGQVILEISEKDAKTALTVSLVRGQKQHFRTKFEDHFRAKFEQLLAQQYVQNMAH
jgi:hypothetical protein